MWPVFGAVSLMVPAVAANIAAIYACSAICTAYEGTVIGQFSADFSSFSRHSFSIGAIFLRRTPALVFLRPLALLSIPMSAALSVLASRGLTMVTFYGNGMSVALALSLALAYMALCVVPLTRVWIVKKKFRTAALYLSRALELAQERSVSRANARTLLAAAGNELGTAVKLLPFAQMELFWCSVEGFKARAEMLRCARLLVAAVVEGPLPEEATHAALASMGARLVASVDPKMEAVALISPPDDGAAAVLGLHRLLADFDSATPYVQHWDLGFLKGICVHGVRGWMPG